ncbi:hypothetical protein [Flavobacterium sp.]|uniref:hypothetical protein n=1 Tax=Flavobacterium sp. TaxID=239 RepID=UPI003A8FE316
MGTTIGDILISYDVDRFHPQVKQSLQNLGYFDNFKNPGDPKISSDSAMADLKRVCIAVGAKLEKAVTVKATEFVGI